MHCSNVSDLLIIRTPILLYEKWREKSREQHKKTMHRFTVLASYVLKVDTIFVFNDYQQHFARDSVFNTIYHRLNGIHISKVDQNYTEKKFVEIWCMYEELSKTIRNSFQCRNRRWMELYERESERKRKYKHCSHLYDHLYKFQFILTKRKKQY